MAWFVVAQSTRGKAAAARAQAASTLLNLQEQQQDHDAMVPAHTAPDTAPAGDWGQGTEEWMGDSQVPDSDQDPVAEMGAE